MLHHKTEMYIFIDRKTGVGRFVLSLRFIYIDMNRSLLWFSACFYNRSAYIFLYEKTLNVRWLYTIMPSLYDVAAYVFLNEKSLKMKLLHTMMLLTYRFMNYCLYAWAYTDLLSKISNLSIYECLFVCLSIHRSSE